MVWNKNRSEESLHETGGDVSKIILLDLAVKLFSLGNSLLLGPPVLEPDLDLGVRQLKFLGKVRPLSDGEITLGFVLLLQLVQLLTGEGSPGLPVRSVFPQDWSDWKDWRLLVLEVPQHQQLGLRTGEEGWERRGREE